METNTKTRNRIDRIEGDYSYLANIIAMTEFKGDFSKVATVIRDIALNYAINCNESFLESMQYDIQRLQNMADFLDTCKIKEYEE